MPSVRSLAVLAVLLPLLGCPGPKPAPKLPEETLADSTVGLAYSRKITASGGSGTLGYTATGLPAGLSLDSGGTLSGLPLVAGDFSVAVTVTDSANQSDTRAYPLKIFPALGFRDSPLPDAVVNATYSASLPINGGKTPLTFVVSSGQLPPGITLSPSSGLLSGVATAMGTYNFGVQAQDANGANANKLFTLDVNAVLAITTTDLATGNVGTAYSDALQSSGGRAPVRFALVNGTLPPGLSLSSGGVLSGTPTVAGTFSFNVSATDAGSASASKTLTVRVLANAPPRITTATLPNAVVGAQYNAVLEAQGGNLPYTWTLLAGPLPQGLSLAPNGVISGTPNAAGSFPIQVSVADGNGQSASRAYTLSVVAPLQLSSGTLADGYVGTGYSVTLTASGGRTPYTWSAVSGLPPGVLLSSAGVLTGMPTTAGSYGPVVRVTDAAGQLVDATFAITLYEQPAVATASLPDGAVSAPYSQTVQGSGGKTPYTFSVVSGPVPTGLSFSSGGTLSGTPTAAGSFSFTVRLADANNRFAVRSFAVNIYSGATIVTGALPDAYVGTAYNQTLVAAGGQGPYSWMRLSGALPPGVTLSSSGVLSGTPTVAGTFTFDVRVIDSTTPTRDTFDKSFTLAVLSPPTVSTTSLDDGYVGSAYSKTLAGTDGRAPYTFAISSGVLAQGLTLSSGGLISGTPTATAEGTAANLSVRLTDANGVSATRGLSLSVYAAVAFSTVTLPGGYLTVAYSASLTATGGKGALTFDLSQGTLPPGLTLDAGTGAISGTPTTPGTYNFTARATDVNGRSATRTLSILVAQALAVGTGALADAYSGTAYSATLSASGGRPPYAFSVAAGSLPAGLSLASGGALSGTPTAAGTANFTVQVTDANGTTASRALSLIVHAPLVFTTTALADGYLTEAYSASVGVSGGRSPYTWAVTTAALPAGLSLNAGTGALSGTPTVANSSNSFGVTVTDANGVTVSRGFTLGVYTLPSITTSSLAEGYGGDPYSATLQATGGKGPTLGFSITAGALPPGLTLSSNGTLGTALGAVANGQTYNFTATVADANGRLGSRALSITTWLVPSVANTSLTTATEGITYRRAPATAEGITAQNGKPPLTYAATGLPAGLSLSASTGVISGIPAQGAAGDYNVTLRVTDASSRPASRVLPLRVNAAQPIAYGGTGGLEPAGSPITDVLTVFVIDSAGRPVQNLGVRVRKNGAEYSPVKQALTSAAGKVFFTGMGCNGTTDTVDVTVNGPGFANFTLAKVNAALVTLTPAEYPLPMPRYAAAASFDGSVGRVVLTGGYTDPNGYASNRSACVDDVVRYSLSTNTWTEEVTPGLTTSPSPRGHAAMAYGGGVNVLFGGDDCHDGFYLGDTWEWNATTRAWQPGGGATRPSARTGAMMTINSAGNGVLLFGGHTGSVHSDELWNYDVGTHSWNRILPLTNSPAGRYHGGAAYHGANAEMWICGGLGGSGELADCAGYHSSSGSWNVRPSLPQARSSFAMAYGGWMYIFGGQSGGVDRNDLLYFNGTTWQTVAVPPGAPRPEARTQAALVYDQSSGKLVLVGGYSRTYGVLNDWWTYDTVNGWVQRNTPPAVFGTTVVGTITGGRNTASSFAQVTLTGASGYSSQQTVQLTGGSGSYTFSGVPVGDTVQVVAVNEDRTLAYPGNPSRFWSYASSGTLTAAAAGLTHNVVFPAGPLALQSATGTYSLPNEWPSALVTGFPRQQRPGFPAATNGGFAVTAPGTFRFDYFTPAAPAAQTAYLGARNDDPTGCELSYFHWSQLSPGAQGNVALVAGPRSITPGQSVCRPAGNGFRYRATVQPGLDPVAMALGDVDGDGLQDMAVANSTGNSVTVAFGQGAGYFGEPGDADYVTLTTSVNNPTGVVIADVDGDGRGEVLVTNSLPTTPGTLAVFKWQTSGSFATPLTFNVGLRPAGLAVAEINNDNRPDVVVVNYGSSTLTPLTGNGSGAFTAQNTIALPAGAAGPAAVALGDVTGDGRADAVVAAYDSNNVVVFSGNGNASGTLFGFNRTLVAGLAPRALALGDVNNDGKRDLVVANELDSSLFIYPGTGTPTAFGTSSGIVLDGAPTAVAVAELTGDSFRDVAVTLAVTNELHVYRGSSTGVVSTPYDIRGTNESPVAVAVADIVLDGKADIAVACYSGLVPYYVQLTPLQTVAEGTYSFSALAGTRMYWATRGPSRLVMDWQYVSRGAPGTNSFSFPLPSSLTSSRPAPSGQTVAWDVNQYSYPVSSTFSYDNFRWRDLRQDATNFVASQGHVFIRQ